MINIIGDPVAIFVLDMGIGGAAYATTLGQFVSLLICALYLRKSKTFRISVKSFKIKKSVLGRVAALDASSFLTQFLIVLITVINNILPVKYGAASAYGAKKYDRVRKLLGLMFWWTAAVCVLFEGVPCFFIRMFGADGELYT